MNSRINLGCGRKPTRGWQNVDLYTPEAEIKADIRSWEGPGEGQASQVKAIHVLEHLQREETIELCRKVLTWLEPGGCFVVEMPCRGRCLKLCASKDWKDVTDGVKGLMGGVAQHKEDWNNWLMLNAKRVAAAAESGNWPIQDVPERFYSPGQQHVYVWEQEEFVHMLFRLTGHKKVNREAPLTHGKREKRDMRIVCWK